MRNRYTYKRAGVDIDAGNRLVERLKPLAAATARAGTEAELGGFGGLFDLKSAGFTDPVLVAATDGVGTKLKIATACDRHDTIGIDLVAMCVNDLLVQGAEPLFFLDYFSTGRLRIDTAEAVVAGVAAGCRSAGCALIGGETAEMPGLYDDGDYDLAGFAVGAAERDRLLPRGDLAAGDVIIGLASTGLHANGYSLVRRLVADLGLAWQAPAPFDASLSLGEALLAPTRIYVREAMAAMRGGEVKAFAHITGGGLLENLPRVLPDHLDTVIDVGLIGLPPVFRWLQSAGGIAAEELARTFNCGIGFVAVSAPETADAVLALLRTEGSEAFPIGRLEPGTGSVILAGDLDRW